MPKPKKQALNKFLYHFSFSLFLAGLLFFIVLNITASILMPKYQKQLLQNPKNTQALKDVILQNQNPELANFLKTQLWQTNPQELVNLEKAQQARQEKINALVQLLRQAPQYPDGHASIALFYYEQGQCELALYHLNKALSLDPVRPSFLQLKQTINQCLSY